MEIKNLKREIITPEMAEKYLAMNTDNRRLRPNTVSAYMADMLNGEWNDSPDIMTPIMISREGRLIDGQHRLTAVKLSGVPVVMWVMTDVDDSTYRYLDAGARRTTADQIGGKHANDVAALATKAFATQCGTRPLASSFQGKIASLTINSVRRDRVATRSEALRYAEENYEHLSACVAQGRRLRSHIKAGSPSTYSFFVWLLDYVYGNASRANDFVDEMVAEWSSNATISACKMSITRTALSTSNVAPTWLLGMLLAAYDHFVIGDNVTMLNKWSVFISKYDKKVKEKREMEAINGAF